MKLGRAWILVGGMALLCPLLLARQPILDWVRRGSRLHFVAERLERPWVFNRCGTGAPARPGDFRARFEKNSCAYSATADAIVTSEFAPGPYGDLPVVTTRSRKSGDASVQPIVVVLVGGPGDSIYPDFNQNELARYLVLRARDGLTSVTIGYLGTNERSLFPGSDLKPAIAEITALVSRLRRERPHAPVALLGVSLGGYLAGRLAGELPDVPILSINPLLASPRARLAADLRGPYFSKYAYRPVREYSLARGQASFSKEEMVPVVDRVAHFFGRDFALPLSQVVTGDGRNLTVLYSRSDDRIGIEALPDLKTTLPRATFAEAGRGGHAVSDVENFHAYKGAIAEFIGRHLLRHDERDFLQ